MELSELAAQYRQTGEQCRAQLSELSRRLNTEPMGETLRIRLRHKAMLLATMTRDLLATSNYLEHYYESEENL